MLSLRIATWLPSADHDVPSRTLPRYVFTVYPLDGSAVEAILAEPGSVVMLVRRDDAGHSHPGEPQLAPKSEAGITALFRSSRKPAPNEIHVYLPKDDETAASVVAILKGDQHQARAA